MDIVDAVAWLAMRLSRLEGRVAGTVRHGTVAAVDAERKRCRLRLGGTDETPYLGPWVPYAQVAGALKLHSPPSVGQQMTMMAAGGDPRQAIAVPMTWSTANPSPSDDASEHVATFGDFRLEVRGGEVVISVPRLALDCGGSTFELTGDGLALAAATAITGAALTHNGHDVGDSHVHTAVAPGGALSGPPP